MHDDKGTDPTKLIPLLKTKNLNDCRLLLHLSFRNDVWLNDVCIEPATRVVSNGAKINYELFYW